MNDFTCRHRIAEIIEYWSPSGSSILYKRVCRKCKKELPKLTWVVE